MAALPNSNSSNITMALAGKTTTVNVPKARENGFWIGKDTFAMVAARSLPITKPRASALPTPPNSISPSLPPLGFKNRSPAASPTPPPQHPVDSDIDLEDAVDHAKAQDQVQRGLTLDHGHENLAGLDSVGAITPALLAKHHLPAILLAHGPLAIRHVMGHLTASVPGFAGIPPAKARRLVVAALEGKGSGGESGGLNGDVDFEKIGWGRWTAKRRGDHHKDSRGIRRHSPLATRRSASGRRTSSPYLQGGVRIPLRSSRQDSRSYTHRKRSTVRSDKASHLATSYDRDEDMEMPTEADKMSLDGDESGSTHTRDESPYPDDDLGEVTDEEDWASIGAAALRQGSFPASSGGGGRIYNAHVFSTSRKGSGREGGPSPPHLALSVPGTKSSIFYPHVRLLDTNLVSRYERRSGGDDGAMAGLEGLGNDSQEREAVEALLRLGSV